MRDRRSKTIGYFALLLAFAGMGVTGGCAKSQLPGGSAGETEDPLAADSDDGSADPPDDPVDGAAGGNDDEAAAGNQPDGTAGSGDDADPDHDEPGDGERPQGELEQAPMTYRQGCSRHDECVLQPKTCCVACGVGAEAFYAIRRNEGDEYFDEECGGAVSCDSCAAAQGAAVVAACVEGLCTIADAQRHPDTAACEEHGDCQLTSSQCCACGEVEPEVLVSVSDVAAFESLICDEGVACEDCEVIYPPDAQAFCARGACALAIPFR